MTVRLSSRWQDYLAGIARAAARGSKDASTKVGAVIYRPDRSTASTGFNGLPSGIRDDAFKMLVRSWKYPRMVHAEANAIDKAKEPLDGYGIVVTAHPCSKCALRIINKGIKYVYYIPGLEDEERWRDDMELARQLFKEANVELYVLDVNAGLI